MILKYPYPYKAALSIANDIDFMPFDTFLALHDFFARDRVSGGLELEFTDSMFFFNNGKPSTQLSYFNGVSFEESRAAPALRELVRCGYIDTIHGYGCFNQGSFSRTYVERLLEELEKHDLAFSVWSNHGSFGNIQNIGGRDGSFHYHQQGDVYESNYYHRDLLERMGVRYYCLCSSWTHHFASSPNCKPVSARWQQFGPFRLSWPWRKRGAGMMPLNPNWKPSAPVLYSVVAADGAILQGFRRFWGTDVQPAPDLGSIARQVTDQNLNDLIQHGGVCILYQHFATLERVPKRRILLPSLDMSDASRLTLETISRLHHEGEVWFTGLTRLLDFIVMRNEVRVKIRDKGTDCELQVSVSGGRPFKHGCEGLSVVVPGTTRRAVFVQGARRVDAELIDDKVMSSRIAKWPIRPLPVVDWKELAK